MLGEDAFPVLVVPLGLHGKTLRMAIGYRSDNKPLGALHQSQRLCISGTDCSPKSLGLAGGLYVQLSVEFRKLVVTRGPLPHGMTEIVLVDERTQSKVYRYAATQSLR